MSLDSRGHIVALGALNDDGTISLQTGPFGSQLHAHDYRPSGTPIIPTEAIGRRLIADTSLPRVDDETVSRLARHKLCQGDILFARRGAQATGLSAIVDAKHEGALCGTGAILLRVNDRSVLDPSYLSFALAAPNAIGWLKAHAVGAVMPNLNADIIRRLEIPLPPPYVQIAIAQCLGSLEDKIDLNRRMNETLEEIAQALFRNWFVDVDQDDANTWGQTTLGDLVTLQRGTTYQGSLVGMPGPALLGLGSIEAGGGFREGRYKTYGGDCPEKLTLHPGDIFVALKGATKDGSMVGSVARVPPSVSSGRLTQDTVKLEFIRLQDGMSSFTYRLLLTPEYRTYCAARITGSAQVGLSREDFLGYSFRLAPGPLLAKFGHVESLLMARKHAADVESRTLAELRDLLLPKLLSGELRIRDAQREVEAVA